MAVATTRKKTPTSKTVPKNAVTYEIEALVEGEVLFNTMTPAAKLGPFLTRWSTAACKMSNGTAQLIIRAGNAVRHSPGGSRR